jgi:hypothetical protein
MWGLWQQWVRLRTGMQVFVLAVWLKIKGDRLYMYVYTTCKGLYGCQSL